MISIFDLYKIGIGPSSSHTVGPMKAANYFLDDLKKHQILGDVTRVHIELFGSLGATGKGHASDVAVILGLMGELAEKVDTNQINDYITKVRQEKQLILGAECIITFDQEKDLILHSNKSLPYHPNAMTITAFDEEKKLASETYYSLGGGFVVNEHEIDEKTHIKQEVNVPFPYSSAEELLKQCKDNDLSIAEIVLENEKVFHLEQDIFKRLSNIWLVMQECVINGCHNQGVLPGGLKIKRRAKNLYKQLKNGGSDEEMMLNEMDWVNLYAMAVNEENAAGGRVVTAPTNGAAGIIPAVLHYYKDFSKSYKEEKVYEFLLAAAAIGILIKQNASISGAEVGCQGEVGSACAMAAAGLTQILGGTSKQCTNAAEIGIEHNLGLTCDPVAGLVQVPCIERNAIAAVKAINASQIARRGNGEHFVSLDKAIKTMKDTGRDMMDKYKETSKGGLAVNAVEVPVNFVEC